MNQFVDLDLYPIDQPESDAYKNLVAKCRADLEANGMFNLDGFIKSEALTEAVAEVEDDLKNNSFKHHRVHNIFFKDEMPGIEADHPAMQKFDSSNHTVCGDQLEGTVVKTVYEDDDLRRFLAETMSKDELFLMDDPLARVNVMSSRDGEALNWHFDQCEFTTTILLQASKAGGDLEFCPEIRKGETAHYSDIVRLVEGDRSRNVVSKITPGTLNVFRGINTPHRVTTVEGDVDRIITIFSFYEQPGVIFTPEMQKGFYGRSA